MGEINFEKKAGKLWAAPVEQGEVLIAVSSNGDYNIGYKPQSGFVIDFGRAPDYESAVETAERQWDSWPLK